MNDTYGEVQAGGAGVHATSHDWSTAGGAGLYDDASTHTAAAPSIVQVYSENGKYEGQYDNGGMYAEVDVNGAPASDSGAGRVAANATYGEVQIRPRSGSSTSRV